MLGAERRMLINVCADGRISMQKTDILFEFRELRSGKYFSH